MITLCFSFFFSSNLFAQKEKIENLPNFDKKTWNFGYYLGLNMNSFVIKYKDSQFKESFISVDNQIGFNIGVVVERRLHRNLSLRFEPGLMTNVKNLEYSNDGNIGLTNDTIRKVSGTYMHLPLLFKFSTDRFRNIKPYVLGGVSFDHNFASNEKNPDDNTTGDGKFRMKTSNFMYEIGVGMDFYLPYFKFSPSIRGVFAINNELVPDNIDAESPYTGPIDYLGTRGLFIKLTFE